jgi:hypothetical protein
MWNSDLLIIMNFFEHHSVTWDATFRVCTILGCSVGALFHEKHLYFELIECFNFSAYASKPVRRLNDHSF